MLNESSMRNYWQKMEAKNAPPKFVKKINILEFSKLKNR